MLVSFAAFCLISALTAFRALCARERRLVAGEAGLLDLAAWTGLTDRKGLLKVAGIRERQDGSLRLDPRFVGRLPAHPIGRALDSYIGNGLCIAVSLAALGWAAENGSLVGPIGGLVVIAGLYQLLGRLWSAAIWLELRAQR